tara:strand:+ start:324 stop:671 length:348 start_codon:yes stop_codon:yes gene_type:complete
MTKKQIKVQEKQEALETLRKMIPEGSTVFTVLRRVSQSGMSRNISLVVFKDDGQRQYTIHPNYTASKLLGWKLVEDRGHSAIRVSGCGMDMGFHLVYTLGSILYGDGYKLKQEWI